jgi:O-antigen/teichoic acid export membrane protein
VFLFTSLNLAVDFCELKPSLTLERFKRLFMEGLPLFLSLFLNMYLSNAPKYAIDAYLTEEIQAAYNLIFMPAYVVQLVALFIFNPILTTYAELWVKGELKTLYKLIRRQLIVIIGLTLLGLAVAATIGIPVLSIVFNADLWDYKRELCIVMVGGGMLAFSVFFTTVITIIRQHNTLIISYGIAAAAAYFFSGPFVKNYGIFGATLLYAVIMTILTLLLGIILFVNLRKNKITED